MSSFRPQLVCHWVGDDYRGVDYYNPVDGDEVPVAHPENLFAKYNVDTETQPSKGEAGAGGSD